MKTLRLNFIALGACAAILTQDPASAREVDAVTFSEEPSVLHVPVTEAASLLRWPLKQNQKGRCIELNGLEIPAGSLRATSEGTELISASLLAKMGAEVSATREFAAAIVRSGRRSFELTAGGKRVEIDLSQQLLQAWQGDRLVLKTRISSGRNDRTPTGSFSAGPYKARWHTSSLYNNAPMPWSVQISGNVFIHGFTSVPNYPASHGCIRLPLDGINPAKFFYDWVDRGTPVKVVRGTSVAFTQSMERLAIIKSERQIANAPKPRTRKSLGQWLRSRH